VIVIRWRGYQRRDDARLVGFETDGRAIPPRDTGALQCMFRKAGHSLPWASGRARGRESCRHLVDKSEAPPQPMACCKP
jgi:hypothetical protein